jgi:phosphoesterase RecJ-like protein
MNNFKTLSLDEACAKILNASNPVIAIHRSPDGDALGSAVALFYIFRALGKSASYICADDIPERLEFLQGGLTNVPTAPYSECNIICLDVASQAQLGRLPEAVPEVLSPYLMIDHHAAGEVFADNYIRTDACATGEIIFDIAKNLISMGALQKIDSEMAEAMYAAISSDSGCFKYSNTKPHTHEVASELISLGIDASEINRLLFDSKSEEVLRAEGITVSKMHTFFDGYVNLACITKSDREDMGLKFEHFETSIDVVRALRGVGIAVVIKQQDDGVYKISMRSTGADVAKICAKFGGGGHIRASGCSISACDEKEVISKVISAIEEEL